MINRYAALKFYKNHMVHRPASQFVFYDLSDAL